MNHGKSTSEEVQGDAFPGNAHDPLCFEGVFVRRLGITSPICICTIISAARADEREKAAQRAQDPSLHSHWCVLARPYQTPDDVCDCEHADVIAAVRGES